MNHGFILWNANLPIFVELHAHLLIDQQNIMHLGLELRIPPFAVVPDLVWLNVGTMQNLLNHWLSYRLQARKSSFDSMCLESFTQGLPLSNFVPPPPSPAPSDTPMTLDEDLLPTSGSGTG